ncbi:glutamate synthase subunit beta [Tenacibaculum sp. IB213877]|uniref:glutamate synthase subunit beta n=1 Tax=Tenacibaculum sp. IB213877 TaxID=3097351 RepID=UPI002A5A66B4|nr:glutamate synthase subunit beta [Tenacibaculum sp. IB213877]MDY0779821.1 glutamate synthase subunit beta [Tenacibaculum sp. IB213877]
MGQTGGFQLHKRENEATLSVKDRIENYEEFTVPLHEESLKNQGARCMSCGVPFCHSGCPLGNLIPDFNDMVYKGEWKKALEILHATNNFPEFTGRLCPAPCEKSCVLGLIDDPVSIESIEKHIVEKGFSEGWIVPKPPKIRTNKTVAVIGSGPAGLATAQQLNRAGHTVTVFEREDKIGGLLRYGIPNFKLDKNIIDRRLKILEDEGIIFKTNTNVGIDYPIDNLKYFDAIVLCGGATVPRSLPIKGIESKGVLQAIDFLTQQTKQLFDNPSKKLDTAKHKHVIVIGGGDTGSDCIGTSIRQGAKSVTNFEIMPKPPQIRSKNTPWPYWPLQLKTTTSHEEGCDRNWLINTKEFITNDVGQLIALKTINVEWKMTPGERPKLIEIEGTEKTWPCDLVLLALGFTGPENTLANQLGIETDAHSNYKTASHTYQTNISNVFTAGDMRRGQSLIVWAISEGREAAKEVNIYLSKKDILPTKGEGNLLSA